MNEGFKGGLIPEDKGKWIGPNPGVPESPLEQNSHATPITPAPAAPNGFLPIPSPPAKSVILPEPGQPVLPVPNNLTPAKTVSSVMPDSVVFPPNPEPSTPQPATPAAPSITEPQTPPMTSQSEGPASESEGPYKKSWLGSLFGL